MLLEQVLRFLDMHNLKELVVKLGTEYQASLESRTELLSNFLSQYDWLTLTRREFLKKRQPQKIKLVLYATSLRKLMDVGEEIIQ